ncbi:MAG: hypothetical protein L3J66_05620 [Bacteroidales bacterium]|nr:hypothetical protein [Bacteroidales bacterium]
MKKIVLITSIPIILIVLLLNNWQADNIKTKRSTPATGPGEWMAAQRMYPYDEIKQDVYLSEMKKAAQMSTNRNGEIEWEFVGPTNIGGRITDIEMPEGQSQVIYVGGASGGILKTEDAGNSWEQKFFGVPTVSIGDMAIDPDDPDILYVGTGEANASSYSFLGSGIYKSLDGGDSWQYSGLEAAAYFGRVIVDHGNSQRVFAAACGTLFSKNDTRGIYRSTDGGQNWEQVLFVSDSTAAIDLVQHPVNPDILYAAFWERERGLTWRKSFGPTTGIWKTTDGGDTWLELTNGLPGDTDKGRVGLTISKSNPNVLYAIYDMPDQSMFVFKTSNGGNSWERVDNNYLHGMGSSFAWYFGQIRVDPNDEDRVFALGQIMYRTNNSGNNWSQIATNVHVDHHAMFFDQSSGRVYLGNDGGLYWSTNNGNSWNKINNLPLTQFYGFDISNTSPDFMIGGTQDNNSIRTIGGNTLNWQPVWGGDGMQCAINQQNNDIAFVESQWGGLGRSFNATSTWPSFDYIGDAMGGDRTNWSAPIVLTPGNDQVVYFGTYRVWKSIQNGSNWVAVSADLTDGGFSSFNTLTTLAVSSLNQNHVLAGSADGNVHISLNAGLSWTSISSDLPDRWITRVAFDPIDEETIYVTVSGFRWDEALPHVYKSTDLGENWEDISGDLPEIPVNAIVINPINNEKLIVGTDAGTYITHDGGASWENMAGNMPQTPVVALKINPNTNWLYAATYGNSIYKVDLSDLYVGNIEWGATKQNFDAKLVYSVSSKFIVIENNEPQAFLVNVYSLSGRKLGAFSTGLLQEGKTQLDVTKYFRHAKEMLLFEVVGKSQKQTLKGLPI